MAEQDFKLSYKGEVFSTGLIIPDKIPLSFAEYPVAQVHELAALKKIYSAPGRKLAVDIYKRRKNQGRMSSCCPYAATNACEAKRAFDRKEDVEFGPEWLYANINGGRDGGAMLDDAMKELLAKGCCLRGSVPYEIYTTNKMSMEQKRFAAQQAMEYRALDWHTLPIQNLEACWAATLSSIANRDPVLMAVHCGDGFFSADGQGNAKVDRGPGNHAVCGVELVGVESAKSLRDIKIITINSHGQRYGKDGCYLHTYDHMAGPVQYHQHCACRSMRTSPDEKISTLLA